MTEALRDWLWEHTWWSYQPDDGGYSKPYHWFNLLEGSFWIFLSALVLWRYLRHRRSPGELLYSFVFLLFGISDFREAYALETWLIWAKGVILLALLCLRRWIMRRYYPGSRIY